MKLYSFLILFLCVPLFSFGNTIKKHEKSKSINKTYSVDDNATLYVSNKYGNINISTWDKNVIEINIKITVKGNDLNQVDDKLNSIRVNFEASKSLVEARTYIEKEKSNWSWWGNSNKTSYQINYTIKMPKTNNVDLLNKYGEIELDELEGKANIKCNYGNIDIEKLLNDSNYIKLQYCGGSSINYMKNGTLNADYSKITINKTENLKSSIDYTTLKIGNVNKLSFSSDYGSLSVKEATHVSGNSDYASMRFENIYKSLDVDTDYAGIRINNIAKGFENITINGSYSGIKIGTSEDNNFTFSMNLKYASFRYPEDKTTFYKSIKKNTSSFYEGAFGNKKTNSTIQINSNYGGVSIKSNN